MMIDSLIVHTFLRLPLPLLLLPLSYRTLHHSTKSFTLDLFSLFIRHGFFLFLTILLHHSLCSFTCHLCIIPSTDLYLYSLSFTTISDILPLKSKLLANPCLSFPSFKPGCASNNELHFVIVPKGHMATRCNSIASATASFGFHISIW